MSRERRNAWAPSSPDLLAAGHQHDHAGRLERARRRARGPARPTTATPEALSFAPGESTPRSSRSASTRPPAARTPCSRRRAAHRPSREPAQDELAALDRRRRPTGARARREVGDEPRVEHQPAARGVEVADQAEGALASPLGSISADQVLARLAGEQRLRPASGRGRPRERAAAVAAPAIAARRARNRRGSSAGSDGERGDGAERRPEGREARGMARARASTPRSASRDRHRLGAARALPVSPAAAGRRRSASRRIHASRRSPGSAFSGSVSARPSAAG